VLHDDHGPPSHLRRILKYCQSRSARQMMSAALKLHQLFEILLFFLRMPITIPNKWGLERNSIWDNCRRTGRARDDILVACRRERARPFRRSGSTLIGAEQTGQNAYLTSSLSAGRSSRGRRPKIAGGAPRRARTPVLQPSRPSLRIRKTLASPSPSTRWNACFSFMVSSSMIHAGLVLEASAVRE
jgi:hypothetical protein